MIEKTTRIELKNLTAIDVSNFMINCTDAEYQEWWPDVHLAFHTMKRFPREVGNLVFFDEYTGKRRLRFMAFVTEFIAGKKVVWQLKSLILLASLDHFGISASSGWVDSLSQTCRWVSCDWEASRPISETVSHTFLPARFGRACSNRIRALSQKI